jgi:O-acetyl-ADP-ribose deacetylase (regulator of RNase III)/uncharacterized protein YwgA
MARIKVRVQVGDLFRSDAQTLINTVNCVGVMGKGIALQFKQRYPAMFDDYQSRCNRKLVKLGEPFIYKGLTPPWIINFPTKLHWKMPSSLSAIKDGLVYLTEHLSEWGVESISSPPLGCGLGQLDWRSVGPVLYQGFLALDIPVVLFAPPDTPLEQMTHSFLSSKKSTSSPSQAEEPIKLGLIAVIETLNRISMSGLYFAGSVVFHKMVYFGTTRGLPTGLRFTRGIYGPYSEELLKQEIPKLIRHELLKQKHHDNSIQHEVGDSYKVINWKAELQPYELIINDLVDLLLRLKSTDQAELYATVHYCAEELKASESSVTEIDVLREVADWKRRRRIPFNKEEVSDAIRTLTLLKWINVSISNSLPLPSESRLELMGG